MESKFSNVMVEPANNKKFVERDFIKTKQMFPINITKEFRITGVHPARQLFLANQMQCRSNDAVVGRSRETEWKVEIECATCPHKAEEDRNKRCAYKFVMEFEHEDPEKVYILTTGYTAQLAFTDYLKSLIAEGLDADQVMTKITRIENPDGVGTVFTFAKGEVVVEADPEPLTASEQMAVTALREKIKSGVGPIDVDKAAMVLGAMDSFGISDERAVQIAAMIAVDGMITA